MELRTPISAHYRVIGSDSPHISLDIVVHARTALDDAGVVLGPADDCGYYLIAMHNSYDVFSGIPMSTSVVIQMTIKLAEHQGLKVHLLKPLFDVYELPDLYGRIPHLHLLLPLTWPP